MAEVIVALLTDEALRKQLDENTAKEAIEHFDLKPQVEAYLGWYEEIIIEGEGKKRWARQGRDLPSMELRAKP